MNSENYREVYLILNKLGNEYINKIPKKVYNHIKENMATSGPEIKIIKKESIAFIAALHYKFWTENEEEKQELLKIFNENAKEQEEKYNIDKIFEKRTTQNEVITQEKKDEENNLQLIKVEKWYTKLIRKIKKFFRIGDKNNW